LASPLSSLLPRTLGFSAPRRCPTPATEWRSTLLHFTATSACCPPTSRLSSSSLHAGYRHGPKSASLKLHGPSAFAGSNRPSFAPHRSMRRPENVTLFPGGAALRVWLPSRRIELSLPREPISAPNAPGLRPSELFSFRVIERRFPFPVSAPALPHKTREGLVSALQRLHPTRKAAPLIATRCFMSGRGRVLSWDSPPSRLSRRESSPGSISLPGSPLPLFPPGRLTTIGGASLRVSLSPAWRSPSEEGAGLLDVSGQLSSPSS
jgi:hypothetical protein